MRTSKFWLNLIGIALATSISYLVPLLITLGSTSFLKDMRSQVLVAVGGLLGTVVLVVYQQVVFSEALLSEQRKKHRKHLDEVHHTAVKALLEVATIYVPPQGATVRVCLFLLDEQADQLTMYPAVAGSFLDCEKDLKFKEHEGGAGYVLWHWRNSDYRQDTHHVDLSGPKEDVINMWRLTEEVYECTKDVKQLMTVALKQGHGRHKLFGVLSIDSQLEKSQVDLAQNEVAERALHVAHQLEPLLLNHLSAN